MTYRTIHYIYELPITAVSGCRMINYRGPRRVRMQPLARETPVSHGASFHVYLGASLEQRRISSRVSGSFGTRQPRYQ